MFATQGLHETPRCKLPIIRVDLGPLKKQSLRFYFIKGANQLNGHVNSEFSDDLPLTGFQALSKAWLAPRGSLATGSLDSFLLKFSIPSVASTFNGELSTLVLRVPARVSLQPEGPDVHFPLGKFLIDLDLGRVKKREF